MWLGFFIQLSSSIFNPIYSSLTSFRRIEMKRIILVNGQYFMISQKAFVIPCSFFQFYFVQLVLNRQRLDNIQEKAIRD